MTRPSLTELAHRFGSDKGARKHRYTQLYDVLFAPYRDQPITFMEMGLLIGGPEHGKPAGRATSDAPSVRMWLDYFTRAQVIGLDASDFSWLEHERFRFVGCDMDDRGEIRQAAAVSDALDIIIDDASHASAHQQHGLLEFFPRLVPGGMYIIEDLQWQPPVYENRRPGFTRTAPLLWNFVRTGKFSHSDPELEGELNGLAGDIDGCFIFQKNYDKARRDKLAVIRKRAGGRGDGG
ncbi:MAG: hypothetical protein ACE5FS_14075 [Paracoccaceae bacterium]